MDNVIGYREGASFLPVSNSAESANQVRWQNNVTSGQGWSYGGEMLLQKKEGRFTGWAGYTLSWTQLQFNELNFGRKYFARYDRRHDISLVGIYQISPRITLSGTWVYGTGNALTLPVASFRVAEHFPFSTNVKESSASSSADYYGEKNSFRMAAYHRLDLAVQFHKQKKQYERTWEFGLYNAYSRQNPFYYYLRTELEGGKVLKQVSLFPVIPSASYTFKF